MKSGLDVTHALYLQLQHHPDYITGLILLVDINVNHLKNLDTAEKVGTWLDVKLASYS